jgi:hypothetical protein
VALRHKECEIFKQDTYKLERLQRCILFLTCLFFNKVKLRPERVRHTVDFVRLVASYCSDAANAFRNTRLFGNDKIFNYSSSRDMSSRN